MIPSAFLASVFAKQSGQKFLFIKIASTDQTFAQGGKRERRPNYNLLPRRYYEFSLASFAL
jgi:hypothetical protein